MVPGNAPCREPRMEQEIGCFGYTIGNVHNFGAMHSIHVLTYLYNKYGLPVPSSHCSPFSNAISLGFRFAVTGCAKGC